MDPILGPVPCQACGLPVNYIRRGSRAGWLHPDGLLGCGQARQPRRGIPLREALRLPYMTLVDMVRTTAHLDSWDRFQQRMAVIVGQWTMLRREAIEAQQRREPPHAEPPSDHPPLLH